jgi:hypothetical protein
MIRLVSSEWLRFRSRRLVKVLAAIAAIGIVIGLVIAGVQSHPPAAGSSAWSLPRADLPEIFRGLAFISILIGLVIGASSIGASWQAGTMTTLLTWEPRRTRVVLTRAAIVFVGVFLLVLALLALFAVLFVVTTALRGETAVPPGWTRDSIEVALRVSALAAAASVVGASLAMIGRHTAAALGGVFVYLAVVEGVLRGINPRLSWLLLGDSIAAVVSARGLSIAGGGMLGPVRGAITVAVYSLGLLALATAWFRIRDVQ